MSLLADILWIECDLDSEAALQVFFRGTEPLEHSSIRKIDDDLVEAFYDVFAVYAETIDYGSEFYAALGMTPKIQFDFDPLTIERDGYRDIVLKSVLNWISTSEYNLAWLLYEAFPVLVRRNGNLILNRAYPYSVTDEDPFWTEDRLKLLPPHAWADFPKV